MPLQKAIENIAILPPQFDLTLKTATGSEKLTGRFEQVGINVSNVIARELTRKGFKTTLITKSLYSADPDGLKSIEDAFEALRSGLWNLPPGAGTEPINYKFTLPQNVSNIATKIDTNDQLFVTFSGYTRSGGDIASEVASKTLVSLATMGLVTRLADPSGAAIIAVALVDGKSGDILWGNKNGWLYSLTGPTFEEKDLVRLITKLFEQFPNKVSYHE
jgi:ribosomal protein L28